MYGTGNGYEQPRLQPLNVHLFYKILCYFVIVSMSKRILSGVNHIYSTLSLNWTYFDTSEEEGWSIWMFQALSYHFYSPHFLLFSVQFNSSWDWEPKLIMAYSIIPFQQIWLRDRWACESHFFLNGWSHPSKSNHYYSRA